MLNGKKLKELRESQNMTAQTLALELGVDRSFVANLEREFKKPSLELTIRIAEFFGVTVDELIKKNS